MSERVMDASFASRLALPNQLDAVARRLLEQPGLAWSAPRILRQEFFNAVRRLETRGQLEYLAANQAMAAFEALEVTFLDHPEWVDRAFATSRRYNQGGIFDAIYLACADDLGAELWTYDGAFVRSFGYLRPANLCFAPEDAADYLARSP